MQEIQNTLSTRLARRNPQVGQVVADLKQQIECGELQNGDKLPSFRDLASRYGTTYRSAQSAVEHLEQLGLIQRVHGSGTYVTGSPEDISRSAVTTNQVSLIFAGQPDTVAPLIQPIMTRLQAIGLVPVPVFYEQRQNQGGSRLSHILRQWETQPPRAIVLKSSNAKLIQLVQQHRPAHTHVVWAYSAPHRGYSQCDGVLSDEFEMFSLAARYLVQRGHRCIGLVEAHRDPARRGTPSADLQHAPIRGMLDVCREAGLTHGLTIRRNPKTSLDPDGLGVDPATVDQLARWLREKQPTAVVGRPLRLSCLQVAADQAGYCFGEDFEVVGVGDATPAHRGEYVCIGEPYDLVAEHVVNLIEAGHSNSATHRIVVPPRFIPRCICTKPSFIKDA